MKNEDVKIGMKVIETSTGDTGTVLSLKKGWPDYYKILWESGSCTGDTLGLSSDSFEPVFVVGKPSKANLQFNAAKIETVVVEEPATITITLSIPAAQELRAICGSMWHANESALYNELKELEAILKKTNPEGMKTLKDAAGLRLDMRQVLDWDDWEH